MMSDANTPKKRRVMSQETKDKIAATRERNKLSKVAVQGLGVEVLTKEGIENSPMAQLSQPEPLARGRTAASLSHTEAETSHLEIAPDRATAAHTPDRPARIRMSSSSMLDIPFELDTENFYYRWMNEIKVGQALQAWYEVVNHPESGEAVKRTKGATTCILMRLPIQYRLEDLQFKREQRIQGLNQAETGGVDKTQDEYSALEGRRGAVKVEGGFDPNAPYNAYT